TTIITAITIITTTITAAVRTVAAAAVVAAAAASTELPALFSPRTGPHHGGSGGHGLHPHA
ncbi:MAG: hypothetical protein KDJ18_00715, partial [Hyphomicrobiaceae bacterium]|nr:hypothetical protein [Hyphomicrobiaceae bacterium]